MASLESTGDDGASAPSSDSLLCQKHNKILLLYCETCQELLCRVCAVRGHWQQHHCVIDVEVTSQTSLKDFISLQCLGTQRNQLQLHLEREDSSRLMLLQASGS